MTESPVRELRVAVTVADSEETARALVDADARQLAHAATTPWNHRNVRMDAPGPLQLTPFTVLESA